MPFVLGNNSGSFRDSNSAKSLPIQRPRRFGHRWQAGCFMSLHKTARSENESIPGTGFVRVFQLHVRGTENSFCLAHVRFGQRRVRSTGSSEVNTADGTQKEWRELCVAVTNERDTRKLSSLVQELNDALDQGERSWRHNSCPPDAIERDWVSGKRLIPRIASTVSPPDGRVRRSLSAVVP